MGRYEGKKVVITGGTSGFGLTTAQTLVDEGARVLVTGRSQENLDAAERKLGPLAVAVRSDAASVADIEALVKRAEAELGTLDALFVNAGITRFVPFDAMTEDVYDELFTVNAKGPYFTVQKFAPLLRQGSGVVLTTSVANNRGIPMISGYSASKAALRAMTRGMARELLSRGIRVNAVSPGPIDTGILERALPAEAAARTREAMTADNPMLRFGDPAEITKAVLFLAF
ncbi:MAG TPA: SDR family NAD(P)-dependent oxidoreductase, partial [Pseudonocardia sp.]